MGLGGDNYGHGEDGDLGDGAVFAMYSACSLINRRQVSIQIPRI